MEMRSSSDLRMDRICHRCGTPISWWDRFRGYKIQCPSCERTVSAMVADRILNSQKKEEKQVTIDPVTQSWQDSQSSQSASQASFLEQVRRVGGGVSGSVMWQTAGVAGVSGLGQDWAGLQQQAMMQAHWAHQQQWIQQQQRDRDQLHQITLTVEEAQRRGFRAEVDGLQPWVRVRLVVSLRTNQVLQRVVLPQNPDVERLFRARRSPPATWMDQRMSAREMFDALGKTVEEKTDPPDNEPPVEET